MQTRGLVLSILMASASIALGGSAWAQQDPTGASDSTEAVEFDELEAADTEKTPGIEERVVLAGESEGAQDFASGDSVKGFDAADLEALGAQNIADLAKFTPNVEIVTAGSTAPTFFIRGIGLNDFNANSSGAVAIYQDDVPLNSPALQLGTLFDMENVNIERGPQGTGAFRNATAGAIKLYGRKPSGNYGGYVRGQYGRFNYVDIEGAVEAPIFEDILASRFAFRYRDRKGFAKNGCGGAPPLDARGVHGPASLNRGLPEQVYLARLAEVGIDPARVPNPDPRPGIHPDLSICGEDVPRVLAVEALPGGGSEIEDGISDIPPGLPTDVNSQHNWAARGIFLFQPTLDAEWLLNAHGSRRSEQSRLGQMSGVGRGAFFCDTTRPIVECFGNPFSFESRTEGLLGTADNGIYTEPDQAEMLADRQAAELAQCGAPCAVGGSDARREANNIAKIKTAKDIAKNLDKRPYRGDYNRIGKTKNDTWGVSVKGDATLPLDVELRSVSGFDTYDRLVVTDLDFSPNTLFQIATDDDGWQFTQDLSFSVYPIEDVPLHVVVGGFYLMEELNVEVFNDFGSATSLAVGAREYTQKIWSTAGYLSAEYDFWEDFTLDGGFGYNYDKKSMDYRLEQNFSELTDDREDSWDAPTGTVRLTYRFREDTHAYWKYTRGWKGGHYNATGSLLTGVSVADPETIDAFEMGLRGAWFDGRARLDLNLFYYNYKDYQIFTAQDAFQGPPEFVILNAQKARVYGLEADFYVRPLSGSFLGVSFGWLESQFLDFVQVQFTQVTIGAIPVLIRKEIQNSGNRLLNSPQFKVSLTAEQTVPLGRFGSLTARWDGAWTDDSNYDGTGGTGVKNNDNETFLPDNTIGQEAFWLHNISLRYTDPTGTVELSGWIRNVENKTYKTFAFDGSQFQSTTIYFVGDPRTYGVTLGVRF